LGFNQLKSIYKIQKASALLWIRLNEQLRISTDLPIARGSKPLIDEPVDLELRQMRLEVRFGHVCSSRGDRLFVEESFFQQTIKLKVPFGIASGITAAIHPKADSTRRDRGRPKTCTNRTYAAQRKLSLINPFARASSCGGTSGPSPAADIPRVG
jgi:hypothetical protein